MKIDIHTHTKKCKSGDAPSRAIDVKEFCETLLSTDVKIVAITNHNVFDLEQYSGILAALGSDAQVWPGIELDILENETRGHLLVIVSPTVAESFSESVQNLSKATTPDTFTASIDDVLAAFDGLNPIYIAHYRQKKPNISDEAIAKLESKTVNRRRVIKEATNSISAGIYVSHGHASIYGSDVQDWKKYAELSRQLPELRLPVDSFEHFCLLLEKDPTAINTVLNRKTSEELVLCPFGDDSLTIRVFNDINVIFGPKGTGKSCLLRSIAKYYSENGAEARVYESASDRLEEIFDIRGKELTLNLNPLQINYCTDEIAALRSAKEAVVTSLSKYVMHFEGSNRNKNASKILLKDIEPEEENSSNREFTEFIQAVKTTAGFLGFLADNSSVKKELGADELAEVSRILSQLLDRLTARAWASFSAWQEIRLLNSAIELFRSQIERKTGAPANPVTTGFRDYAMNRIQIGINAASILRSIGTAIPVHSEKIGSLGSSKGELECLTEYLFQNGKVTDGSLRSLTQVNKSAQKEFASCVRRIYAEAYSGELFQCITDLGETDGGKDIKTVYELLLFRKYFALNGQRYVPSSGEASMVMLQKELSEEKDIYILDEPERSLGNEYINDVIVPLIKERAKTGKKIFISTHDANIAVRTLPYSSIYRCYGPSGYVTYIGNPFSNNLVCSRNPDDRLDWKKVSMRTLEGGEEAFGERGKIYGND